jgi:hypothetical protein
MTETNREAWLQLAAGMIRERVWAAAEIEVPAVQVSCSWPGGGSPAKRIGECWPRKASAAGVNEVFISPRLEDPALVVGVLTHELAHAVDDCEHGHKAGFVKIARAMGCEGKPTGMQPSLAWCQDVVASMTLLHGAFPHRRVDKSKSGQKKQGTRMIKCECIQCGSIWRLTQSVIDKVDGDMSCPICHADVDQPVVIG